MSYIESEFKSKIREIRNSVEPVFDGLTEELVSYEINSKHLQWLLEKIEKYEKTLREIYNFSTIENNLADAQYLAAISLEVENI